MPRQLQSSDEQFRFRSYGVDELDLEGLHKEVEELYEFLNNKGVGLYGENKITIASLDTVVGANKATAELSIETLVTEDSALSQSILELTAEFTSEQVQSTARFLQVNRAFASADSAIALSLTELNASLTVDIDALGIVVTGNSSAVSALTTRVTTAEGNITTSASDITTLQSDLTTAEGDIIANAGATTSLTTTVSGNTTGIGTNVSDISAQATLITNLTATVGTNTANVSTNASAIVTVEGDVTTIEAEWGVAIDINGRVTGRINLNGTNETSTLDLQGDYINFYDGTGDFKPFSITANDGQAALQSTRSIFGDSTKGHLDFVSYATGYTSHRLRYNTTDLGYLRPSEVPTFGYQGSLNLTRSWDSQASLLTPSSLSSGSGFGIHVGGDTSITRDSAGMWNLSPDSGEEVLIGASGGYGKIELNGDTGCFLDLSYAAETDYDMRFLVDTNGCQIITDDNNDLKITPGGTGVLQFGTRTANADAAVTGYITIKDSGGTSRKLAIIA